MHRNENKYDQLFRNRLRDFTHPVRNELWSRIHTGIKVPQASAPRQPFSLLTVAAASVLVITLGIIYFTHRVTPPSAHSVNHYSTTTPAIKPALSTGKSSVTPRDSSGDRLSNPVTATNIPGMHVPTAPGITVTGPNPAPEKTGGAVNYRKHSTSRDPLTPRDSLTPGDRVASGSHLSPEDRTAGTQPHQFHHHSSPVTLPALALTGNRNTITAGTPGSKFQHNSSAIPAKAPHFQRTLYVSLYGSPDFPNHYYTWSYTVGFRATLQFSPRWSFTAGLEYARVNVPTQVVPPVGYGDTLHSFYFSNYEVPVLFGYTRTFRHSTLTVNGGAILNLYFHRSTGVWVFNWPDRDSYGAVLGVDYTRPLNRSLAIFAQPYARYSISDYRMFIQSQRWSFGTLLGLKYRL